MDTSAYLKEYFKKCESISEVKQNNEMMGKEP